MTSFENWTLALAVIGILGFICLLWYLTDMATYKGKLEARNREFDLLVQASLEADRVKQSVIQQLEYIQGVVDAYSRKPISIVITQDQVDSIARTVLSGLAEWSQKN